MMGNYYISASEQEYLAKRKAEAEATERWVAAKNVQLVGDVKTYKGVSYQMKQRGEFICLNLPANSALSGSFTTALTLHRIIDQMETNSTLAKAIK
jgi:hypothetical protein